MAGFGADGFYGRCADDRRRRRIASRLGDVAGGVRSIAPNSNRRFGSLAVGVERRFSKPGRHVRWFDSAIAAFLLILPGFISDLAGLALAAPSLRQMLVRRFGGAGADPAAGYARRKIVDLAPEEWTSFDRQAGPVQH